MEASRKDDQTLSGKGELPPKKRTWERVKPVCNETPKTEYVQSGTNSSELQKIPQGVVDPSDQMKGCIDQGEYSEAASLSASLVAANSKRSIECKFCGQKFSTTQALGGHQNAHRKERDLQRAMTASQLFPPSPFIRGMLRTTPRSLRGPFPAHRFQYHPYNGYSQIQLQARTGLSQDTTGIGQAVGINHMGTSFDSGRPTLNACSLGPMRRPSLPTNFNPFAGSNFTGFLKAMDSKSSLTTKPHMESPGLNLGHKFNESTKMVLPSEIGECSKLKSHMNQNESSELDLNLFKQKLHL